MNNGVRRRLKHKVNAVIRDINKELLVDDIFRGRFVLRQIRFDGYWYQDKSGYAAQFIYRIYDKKNGLFKDEVFSSISIVTGHWGKLFKFVNNFIALNSGIWSETKEERIADKEIDYTKVPVRTIKNVSEWA